MDIEKKIIEIITIQLGMPDGEVNADSTHDSLDMDSLDDIEVLMSIEEEFDLEISDHDGEQLRTVKQAIKYISNRLGEQ